jgi:transcriptional regulator with XRE-family HTH domain
METRVTSWKQLRACSEGVKRMSGAQVRAARKAKGLRQQELARRLGVSQGYVSLLEREHRPVPGSLAKKLVPLLGLSPTELPVRAHASLPSSMAARVLGALGHRGFGYLGPAPQLNPAEILLRTLRLSQVDARVVEALTWLLVQYPRLDWKWLVRTAKQDDLQNRLGFLVTLAAGVAELSGNVPSARTLRRCERALADSRLQKRDTFVRGALTTAEEQWLAVHSSPEAKQWNMLSTLSSDVLGHATA